MPNYKELREFFKRMSGQDNIITIPRVFIEFLDGDLTTALVLNQIVFFSDKTKRTDGFFYKTYKEWEEETSLSKRQVSYSAKKLRDLGLLETTRKKANGAPTVHYRLDYDILLHSIMTKCHIPLEQNVTNPDSDNLSQTLTDDSQMTTTDEGQNDPDPFDTFWESYPRKVKKKNAREKFHQILKSKNPEIKTDAQTIIKGAVNYAKAIKEENTETKFIQHPTTFLNQRAFEDYQNDEEKTYRADNKPKTEEDVLKRRHEEIMEELNKGYQHFVDNAISEYWQEMKEEAAEIEQQLRPN